MSPVWHLHLNIHPDVGSAAYKVCRSPFCQCLKLPSQCTIPLSACCLQEMTLCGRHASSCLCLCIGESNQAAAAGVSARAAPPGHDVTMLPSLEDQIQTPSLSSCYCSALQVGLSSPADNHLHAAKGNINASVAQFCVSNAKVVPHILTDAIPVCPQSAGDDA